jgi:predicted membrane metal-binding protein
LAFAAVFARPASCCSPERWPLPERAGLPRVLPAAFLAALTAGAGFALAWPAPLATAACGFVLSLLACGVLARAPVAACLAGWLAIGLAFGGAGAASRTGADARLLPAYAHARGWIVGRVDGLPEAGPKFILRIERSSLGLPRGVRLACFARGARAPVDGALVRALADVDGPPPRTNPGGFDARAWSRIAGLSGRARIVPGTMRTLAPPVLWDVRAGWVSPVRARLLADVAAQERGRAGAFLAGFLLGDRSRLDPSASDDLRRAGALHLLAISGMHVALRDRLIGRAVALLGLRGPAGGMRAPRRGARVLGARGGSARCGARRDRVRGRGRRVARPRPARKQALGLRILG